MDEKRLPLYERLPEIYRIEDTKVKPPDQLRHFLALVEEAFGEIERNIGDLYRDLFIETCDPWVIPYIGDLLGVSHLQGDPWTLRADVADTIALRRRKGTLASIERLTYNLTRWGVHCVELRERLLWNQHLNHQRPDAGGDPPYGLPSVTRFTPIRGGTVTLRDPASLSLLDSPFDPFARLVDVKPPTFGALRPNLPNLAIFLWRLEDYRVPVTKPRARGWRATGTTIAGEASHVVPFDLHPMGEPLRLFNTYLFDPDRDPPVVTQLDETPGRIKTARLTQGSPAGSPEKYLLVETYDPNNVDLDAFGIGDVGLQLHLPAPPFDGQGWPEPEPALFEVALGFQSELDVGLLSAKLKAVFVEEGKPLPASAVARGRAPRWEITVAGQVRFSLVRTAQALRVYEKLVWIVRGANLCAWETGLQPPVREHEIVIDPDIGRLLIGVGTKDDLPAGQIAAQALEDALLVTYTYGAVGPVGAHPRSRRDPPAEWQGVAFKEESVNYHDRADDLQHKLESIVAEAEPYILEIQDSMTHSLDLSAIAGVLTEDGGENYPLANTRILRAADGQRPVIILKKPLRFRPSDPSQAAGIILRLEGVYLTRDPASFPVGEPLIARAALNRLELIDCTLDPGGSLELDGTSTGTRRPILPSLRLREPYGFTNIAEAASFNQVPEVVLQRTIAGPLNIDRDYQLFLSDTLLDAGVGVGLDPGNAFAITNATDPLDDYGPPTEVNGLTVFGRMRVEQIDGRGGIWVHALQVLNNQVGCLRYSYFSGVHDRLPQNLGCVTGLELHFTSEVFGEPAYGQLASSSDIRIREEGPQTTELPGWMAEYSGNRDPSYSIFFRGGKVHKLGDQMGAYGFLLEAHKWRNLQTRFREFMPVGVRPLLVPVT